MPRTEKPSDGEPPPPKPRRRRRQPDALVLPIVAIRDQVYFPQMVFPLLVGREKSVNALDAALSDGRRIVLVAQRHVGTEDPSPEDLYPIGIEADIVQILRVPDGTVRVMLEGLQRVSIWDYVHERPYLAASVTRLEDDIPGGVRAEAAMRITVQAFEQLISAGQQIPPEALVGASNIPEPGRLADTIVPYLPQLRIAVKQDLLETLEPVSRLMKLTAILKREGEILTVQKSIHGRVEREMGATQKEMILREQLKVIQQELGDRDERGAELDEYRQRISAARMPEAVEERATKELDRLERMPFGAPEGVVIRTYLDWMASLPWAVQTEDNLDIEAASDLLDADHYGLKKVKERILEFLAVRKLAGAGMKGPILCFVGPPGVGKTSIGRSIARALGRKFIRVSLGGVRDEAEVRGHRRTYVGALPGRIIQGIKQVGSRNPVFMLDEIDKLGMDFRGDPSSALLEALDPEQNGEFSDHYIEAPFDLRDVMFITTANLLEPVPPALRDRMEVIHFTGYTEDEKLAIANTFLCKKQFVENGLPEGSIAVLPETVQLLIRSYTREAGVRNLEREIGSICRKVARKVADGDTDQHTITPDSLDTLLGPTRYTHGRAEAEDEIGAATGLVYTEFGGDIVTVEVALLPDTEGRLVLTGQLGDVMKESAQAALTCIRSRAEELGLEAGFQHKLDIHIHVPAGAVPKDGPSAGITIATALASALTRRPVRRDVAMTGEITLRGRVLAVGGVKEKVLAAHRAGIRTLLLPEENKKDLAEITPTVLEEMTFEYVTRVDDVLKIALTAP